MKKREISVIFTVFFKKNEYFDAFSIFTKLQKIKKNIFFGPFRARRVYGAKALVHAGDPFLKEAKKLDDERAARKERKRLKKLEKLKQQQQGKK